MFYFVNKDHLGSITQLIDKDGAIYAKFSYDPWGRMRQPSDWSKYEQDYTYPDHFDILERGFTGHEHMVEFGLINMNGRVYDPVLGQFIQPDNYVQFPEYAGSYNRYSYALNNPLMFTDPSGEFLDPGTIGTIMLWASVAMTAGSVAETIYYDGFEAGMKQAIIAGASYIVSAGVSNLWGLENITADKLMSIEYVGRFTAASVTTGLIMSGITSSFEGYSFNTFIDDVAGGGKNWVQAVGMSLYASYYQSQNNPQKQELLGYNTNTKNTNSVSQDDVNKSIIDIALSLESLVDIGRKVVTIENPTTPIKAKDQNDVEFEFEMKDVETPGLTLIPKSRLTAAELEYIKNYPGKVKLSPDNNYYIIQNRDYWVSGVWKDANLLPETIDNQMKNSSIHERLHIGLNLLGGVSMHDITSKNLTYTKMINSSRSIFNTLKNFYYY